MSRTRKGGKARHERELERVRSLEAAASDPLADQETEDEQANREADEASYCRHHGPCARCRARAKD